MENTPLETLFTNAFNCEKPSKTTAQHLIEQLCLQAQHQKEHTNNFGELRMDELEHILAQLYTYYKPASAKTAKDPVAWVHLAAGVKDQFRKYLQAAYCSDGRLVATDGRRLHMIPAPDGFKPGHWYDEKGNDITPAMDGQTYPDYQRIIPKADKKEEIDFTKLPVKPYRNGKGARVELPDGTLLDKRCTDAAFGKKGKATRLAGTPDEPNLFECEQGTVVIMPMRP